MDQIGHCDAGSVCIPGPPTNPPPTNLAFPPTAQNNEVPRAFELVSVVQNDLVKDKSLWVKFLKDHGLEDIWDTTEVSEQEKYAEMVEIQERAHQEHQMKEEQLIISKKKWLKMQDKGFKPPSPQRRMIAHVVKAGESLDRKRKAQEPADEPAPKRLRVSKYAEVQKQNRLQVVDLRDADYTHGVFRVHVLHYLRGTRYYFGHAGGNYIFRYKESKYDVVGIPKKEPDTWDFSSDQWFHSDFDIPVPEDAHECLSYAGQVPRPLKQYLWRMRRILPNVMRMLLTVVAFDSGHGRRQFGKVYGTLYEKAGDSAEKVLKHLCKKWEKRYPTKDSVPDFLAKEFASHPTILEYILLFSKCYSVSQNNQMLEAQRRLVHLMERAAKKTFWELTEAATIHEEFRARAVMVFNSDSPHVLVYEDEFEDVSSLRCVGTSGGRDYLYPGRSRQANIFYPGHPLLLLQQQLLSRGSNPSLQPIPQRQQGSSGFGF